MFDRCLPEWEGGAGMARQIAPVFEGHWRYMLKYRQHFARCAWPGYLFSEAHSAYLIPVDALG